MVHRGKLYEKLQSVLSNLSRVTVRIIHKDTLQNLSQPRKIILLQLINCSYQLEELKQKFTKTNLVEPLSCHTKEAPLGYKNFKIPIALNSLVINHMKRKLPIKSTSLKPKVLLTNYLLTIILLPRSVNLNYVIRGDIVPLCLIT